jgi:HEAT repeat protein
MINKGNINVAIFETIALKPFAGKVAGSLFSSYLAKKLTDHNQQKQIQVCVEGLCEEWLTSVLKILQSIDFPEEALTQLFPHYSRDFEKFVKDEQVAEELLKPLTETTTQYQLNPAFLVQRWQDMALQALPDEFDMEQICRLYVKRVQKQGVVTSALRQLYLAQLAQESSNYLHAIRGYWPDFELDQYKERVTTRYKTLDLSALTPPARDDKLELLLQDVFIPQTVRENLPPRELPKEFWLRLQCENEINQLPDGFEAKDFKWVQQSTKSVLDIFDKSRMVLLGDPGSGKSSLARFLLLSCLTPPVPTAPDWLSPLKGHLPLLIELRSYIAAVKSEHADNFLEYLHYLGKSEGYALNHEELKEQLKTQPALVIFDGLDEIFDLVQREKITQEIIGFTHDYGKAKVLVTSRIVGYQGQALRTADFNEYTLQDLDSKQIQIFANGWFNLVFRDKPDEISSRIQRIQQAVEHSPAIAQLAGNPLLLTIIAIIARHQELPRERVLLYDHAVRVLCHHWDVTGHKINDTPADFMQEADKLDLLRRVAVRMLASDSGLQGNAIYTTDLQEEINTYLMQRWQLKPTEAARIGQGIIGQLRTRNFILCFYGVNVYGFVHRTFLEYFCALDIQHRFEKKQELSQKELVELFKSHHQDDVWHEILRLICGMIDAKFAGELIAAILPARNEAFQKTKDLTLAIQCLAEIADLQQIPEVAKQVLGCLCGWFERALDRWDVNSEVTEKSFEEKALPAIERIGKNWVGREEFLNWIMIPNKIIFSYSGCCCFGRSVLALWSDKPIEQDLIALTQQQDSRLRYMSLDALARCFKESTKSLLINKLSNSRDGSLVWTLAQHYRDQADTYPFLKGCLQDEDSDVRRVAVDALAEHCRDQADTYPLLKGCLQDEDSDVRRVGVDALAQHYRDQADTYPLLKGCLQNEHSDVRRAAVKALAEHYRDQADTYPLLKGCLQNEHSDVRRAAVDALAQHYRVQADTYPLVKGCLQNEHSDVRWAAVDALAQHYRVQADTYPLLKGCLQNEHSDVRWAAVDALAQHYRDQADTYPLLKDCLQDEDSDVRRAAVKALAEHYRDQADTYPLLKGCLQDEDSDVRRAAVKALAKWHYSEGIKALLLSRDLDNSYPWLDPQEPISQQHITQAAEKLKLSETEIRHHYEEIIVNIPLILE